MRHKDEGDAHFALEPLQFELHLFAELQVQRAQRLVEQQHFRPIDQGARQRHALLLAAGQLLGFAPLVAGQPHHRQRLFDAPLGFGLGDALHLQAKGHVLADGHVREKRVALKDRVDGPLIGRRLAHGAAVNKNLALGRQFKSGDHAQRGRLAAARRA